MKKFLMVNRQLCYFLLLSEQSIEINLKRKVYALWDMYDKLSCWPGYLTLLYMVNFLFNCLIKHPYRTVVLLQQRNLHCGTKSVYSFAEVHV